MLPGPDFPTGGTIINGNDIPNIMKTGHGSVKVRGNYKVNKNVITFYEIPYNTTVEGLLNEINEVCEKEEIKGIIDARDESNKKGLKIVIECDKGVNPESIVLQLFQKTNLQSSFSYNQVALVGKTPTELNLKDCIKIYVDHNSDCIKREAEYEKAKCEKRLEIVKGLLKALADIDAIIEMIKKSNDSKAAAAALISQWQFTEEQAKAILAMRLSSLTKLDGVELDKEKDNLEAQIAIFASWINEPKTRLSVLINRLGDLVKKYGDDRRTIITNIEEPKVEKEVAAIVPEDVVVVLTKSGLIKRIPKASFKTQRRNGKGVKTLDEALLSVVKTNTVDNVLIFSNSGKMYKLLVNNIPIGTNASKGTNIKQLVKMSADEEVIAATTMSYENNAKYVIFFTKNGLVKKTEFEEYAKVKRGTGIAAITLKEDDSLASVVFVNPNDMIQIITANSYSIKFNSNEVAATGRTTQGVKGIKLDNDYVIQGLVVEEGNLAAFSTNGYGKQIKPIELTAQARGGKGIQLFKTPIAGAAYIKDVDSILLIGSPNSICISTSDIPVVSKIAMGNIMIKDSKITKVVTL
jgi:DNA gyrase subunit A